MNFNVNVIYKMVFMKNNNLALIVGFANYLVKIVLINLCVLHALRANFCKILSAKNAHTNVDNVKILLKIALNVFRVVVEARKFPTVVVIKVIMK